MSKHINQKCLYQLPSGVAVHPCRLIHKDGTLMWKHALLSTNNEANMPSCTAHEVHIQKTAQRLRRSISDAACVVRVAMRAQRGSDFARAVERDHLVGHVPGRRGGGR